MRMDPITLCFLEALDNWWSNMSSYSKRQSLLYLFSLYLSCTLWKLLKRDPFYFVSCACSLLPLPYTLDKLVLKNDADCHMSYFLLLLLFDFTPLSNENGSSNPLSRGQEACKCEEDEEFKAMNTLGWNYCIED